MKKSIKIENITCANCALTIENHFKNNLDIQVNVHVPSRRVTFKNNKNLDANQIINEFRSIGYNPILSSADSLKQKRKDLIDLIISSIFTLPLLLTMFHHLGINIDIPMWLINPLIQLILTTPVYIFCGRRFFKSFYFQLRSKKFGMDTLVVLGTSSAYFLSVMEMVLNPVNPNLFFETTAVIIWMVLIGNAFENRVNEKTSDSLFSLMSLESKEVRVKTENGDKLIPIEKITNDMIIRVFAGENIPVDGVVLSGESYVDEQLLTGEAMPLAKTKNSTVFSGTKNLNQTIEIRPTASSEDSTLNKIINTVLETTSLKPKIQRIADRISSWFVPTVVILSIVTFLLWYVILRSNLDIAFSASLSVLVISCPCALGLATPTSISVASGIAFKKGILYKSAKFFEEAQSINVIAFDKTGTLTKGKPIVDKVFGDERTLKIAASLENHTNHPLAKAIIDHFGKSLYVVENTSLRVGLGIEGFIEKQKYFIGSNKYLLENNIRNKYLNEKINVEGKTIVYVANKIEALGYILLSDELRIDSNKVIENLKLQNLKPIMLTGDNAQVSKLIAEKLSIDEYYSNLSPKDKSKKILELQEKGYNVGFVGDGMNDAPALKVSNTGFAVKSGHDIALDSSDVTLMRNELSLVIDSINLSKATKKNIFINFLWAFLYNIICIPIAAMNLLDPSIAGIGMAFSSILVVLNALSLKLYKY